MITNAVAEACVQGQSRRREYAQSGSRDQGPGPSVEFAPQRRGRGGDRDRGERGGDRGQREQVEREAAEPAADSGADE